MPDDDQAKPDTSAASEGGGETAQPGWSSLWQVPALAGGLAMLGLAIWLAVATAPTPDVQAGLDEADRRITAERYQDAISILNERVWPFVQEGAEHQAPESQQGDYHLLVGRAISLAQKSRNLDLEENHRSIRRAFREAERLGRTLEPRDIAALADTNAALGRLGEAIELADTLPGDETAARFGIYRSFVERELASRRPNHDRVLELLGRIRQDPDLAGQDPMWMLVRQSGSLLARGDAEASINRILRSLPRFRDRADPEGLASLYLLLGRSYFETGSLDEAATQLRRGMALLAEGEPQRGSAELYLAQIDEIQGRLQEARNRYALVRSRYPSAATLVPSMLGIAETAAALGDFDGAIAAYDEVQEKLAELEATDTSPVSRERVAESLVARFEDRLVADRPDEALAYARVALDLFPLDSTPANVLLAAATAHRAMAVRTLPEGATGALRSLSREGLDPGTRREAQRYLISAGEYFRQHADRMVLADNQAYASSLWNAADAFDRAGDLESAIRVFGLYVSGLPESVRHAEASFRLARAYQAAGDLDAAAGLYRGLIDQRLTGADRGRVGPYADASYVPLAQVLLLDEDESNDEDAERLLIAVTDGTVSGPEAVNFRDASIALGRRFYNTDRFEEAIAKFESTLDRHADDEYDSVPVRFLLADAYRLSAEEIREELGGGMPDSRRARLEQLRSERLRRAMEEYEHVRVDLERRPVTLMTRLDRLNLRNAYFYLGDCAFDLGDHTLAIQRYDAARERFPNDPASLVAMVQIVNAHVAQDDLTKAITANNRAKRFFDSLPPEVWDDPTLPMSRHDWERWLDSSERLYALEHAAGG